MHDRKMLKKIKKIRVNKIVVIVEIVAILFTLVSGVVFYKFDYDDKKYQLKKTLDNFVEELRGENLFEKYSFDNRDVDANNEEVWYLKELFDRTVWCMRGWYDGDFDDGEYSKKYPGAAKYEFYDKNGTKLCSSNEDTNFYALRIYDENEEEDDDDKKKLLDSYILTSSFTKEQMEEAVSYFGEMYDPYVYVDNIQGYYENDEFVLAGITLCADYKGEKAREYELVNDEILKKAGDKIVVIYREGYDDKYITDASEKEIVKAGFGFADYVTYSQYDDLFDKNNPSRYGDRKCDERAGFYDKDVLNIADKYCSEKAAELKTDSDITYEYVDEGNNTIGIYGVIDNSKMNPKMGDIATVRFAICADVNRFVFFSFFDIIYKFIGTFALTQLLAVFAISVITKHKREAERAKNARNVLINAMAYEMKTPVEIITTSLEKINEGDEVIEKYYEDIICDEAEHISGLVSHMLSYTRKSGVGYELNIGRTDVNAIVKNICGRLKLIAEKRNIEIEVADNGECVFYTDAKLMEIVVDNYISNAIALCKQGGKVLVKIHLVGIEVSYNGRVLGTNDRKSIWKSPKKMDNYVNGKKVSEVSGMYLSGEILKMHGFEYGVYVIEGGMSFYFNRNVNGYYRLHMD